MNAGRATGLGAPPPGAVRSGLMPILVLLALLGAGASVESLIAGSGSPTQSLVHLGGFAGVVLVASGLLRSQHRLLARTYATVNREQHRLASKEAAIIQSVSHEFRTPLTIIRGTLRTLETADPESGRSLLPGLGRAVDRLEGLIEGVLSAADALDDRRAKEHRSLDLAALIQTVAGGLTEEPERVRFVSNAAPLEVSSDERILRQLLRCIIENALKFSGPDDAVDVFASREPSHLSIRIVNRGMGVGPEFLEEAFAAFSQADSSNTRAHGGLGIGLFAAYHLAAQLGGRIEIRSPARDVTEVVIAIPQRRMEDRQPQGSVAAIAASTSGGGLTGGRFQPRTRRHGEHPNRRAPVIH